MNGKQRERWKKDLMYLCYEQGMDEGQAIIRTMYPRGTGDDIIDLALEDWPLRQAEDVDELLETARNGELEEFAKNFVDGIEDGVKVALHQWLRRYNSSLK
jgi:hypothetical protein